MDSFNRKVYVLFLLTPPQSKTECAPLIVIVPLIDDIVFNYITDLIISSRTLLNRKHILIKAVFTLNESDNI